MHLELHPHQQAFRLNPTGQAGGGERAEDRTHQNGVHALVQVVMLDDLAFPLEIASVSSETPSRSAREPFRYTRLFFEDFANMIDIAGGQWDDT
jgi:hypothetical protein